MVSELAANAYALLVPVFIARGIPDSPRSIVVWTKSSEYASEATNRLRGHVIVRRYSTTVKNHKYERGYIRFSKDAVAKALKVANSRRLLLQTLRVKRALIGILIARSGLRVRKPGARERVAKLLGPYYKSVLHIAAKFNTRSGKRYPALLRAIAYPGMRSARRRAGIWKHVIDCVLSSQLVKLRYPVEEAALDCIYEMSNWEIKSSVAEKMAKNVQRVIVSKYGEKLYNERVEMIIGNYNVAPFLLSDISNPLIWKMVEKFAINKKELETIREMRSFYVGLGSPKKPGFVVDDINIDYVKERNKALRQLATGQEESKETQQGAKRAGKTKRKKKIDKKWWKKRRLR